MERLPDRRVDERDTIFARMARRPGTSPYEDYYARHPGRKGVDDRLRAMPELCRPGGLHFDDRLMQEAGAWFARIPEIRADPAIVRRWASLLRPEGDPSLAAAAMACELGAVAAGCAPVPEAFVYTHKGRFDADYGRPVDLPHPHALVFLVEMDFDAMQRAPRAEALRESARQYHRAAVVAQGVAAAIRAAGFAAKPHYDAHYDVILPPLAVLAGLGEIGRNNILVADRFGSRVRIGAVTTDLPLRHASPARLGVRAFCTTCRKCAVNCPAHAISRDGPDEVRGVRRWPTNVERCHGYWRRAGTDCGICMACCPFSHPDSPFHNLVRRLVRHVPLLRRPLLWLDDLVYGRTWRDR